MPRTLFLHVFIGALLAGQFVQAQPANNHFTNAWVLSGSAVSTNGSTSQPSNATKETGEPNHAGFSGGRSVWFDWTAPADGPVRISTLGSTFNTLLAAYTGGAVNALTAVAANDNSPGQGNSSRVEFMAQQGTAYRIAVDGRNNSGAGAQSGSYVLTLQMLGLAVITAPTNGSLIVAGAPIPLSVAVSTPNPPVARVDFYRAGSLFASATAGPFQTVVNDAPPGTNSFFAVMTDGAGLAWTSSVVNVLVLNPGVTLTAPADGAVFLNTNPVTVSAVTLLTAGTVTNVEFFANGAKFSENAASPFSTVWSNVAPGLIRLSAVGMDDAGLAHTSAPVLIAVARVLVPSNSVWRFLDNGSDAGTNWLASGFDDSGWSNGLAQFGYGDGDEATVVSYGPDPNNKFTTTYFRHAFETTNVAGLTNVILRVQRDDGAVVHVNGTEAARYNMPAGPVTFATFAAGVASDDGSSFIAANVPASLLVEGTNVLAVEIHQSDLASSDISFNLELLGVPAIPRNQPPVLNFLSPTNGEVFLAPAVLTLEASATDADGTVTRVEFFAAGAKLGEATNSPYGLVWNAPAIGPHVLRAVATDNEGARTAAVIAITVFDAPGTPLVQITEPAVGAVFQGPTNVVISASVSAAREVTNVLFLAGDSVIGADGSSPFSIVWSNAAFGTSALAAIAFDAQGVSGTSPVVSVIVNAPPDNTNAPGVLSANPPAGAALSNLTAIQVTFSERVVGIDAADLLVNGVPASAVSGNGSNYTFTVARPAYGLVSITWALDHGIVDVGFPPLSFDAAGTGATWTYDLLDLAPPTVAARTPPANATVTNLTQVTVTFSEAVSGVEAGDLLVNGVPASVISSATNTIYTFNFTQPPSGPVTISWAAGQAIADLAVTPNAFDAAGPGAVWSYTLDARTILVQSNAAWRFRKGAAEASAPSDAWRAFVFDDSGWSNALAPFFYGDPYDTPGNPGTLLTDMQNNYTSIYLRRQFVVPNITAVTNLFLTAQSDDGFIAWINGVEVLRYNMPTGEIPFSAVSASSITEPNGRGAGYLAFALPDPAAYLVEGPNVLAVHAFNQSLTTSSDFGFNAQLYTYLADATVAAPRLRAADPAPGEVFHLTNLTVTFTEPVSGVEAGDLLVNGAPAGAVSSGTNTTYTFGFAPPPFGPVVISWAPENGIADFDAPPKPFNGTAPGSILHYTLLNPSVPLIAAQAPPAGATITNLAEITVAFNEAVANVDAADLLVNGAPTASVSGDGTNFSFVFMPPPFGVVLVSWATNHGIQDIEMPPNDFDPARPGGAWGYLLIDPTPTVALLSPSSGAVFQTPVNITLAAGASDNDGFIERVEFFANTARLGEDTNAPFAFTWRNAPPGLHTLIVVATDNSGRTATSAPVGVTVNAASTGLILSGAVWRYLDNGTDQSNAWREVSFDDAAWAAGLSELGYGDAGDGRPEATVVSFGTNANNKYVTTYFRHAFTVEDVSAFTNLLLRLVRDDGAAIYLNGAEIFRDNLPPGDLNFLTLASTNVLGVDEARFFSAPVNPALLVNGTNVMAVEVHQNFTNSADLSFDLELIANVPPAPPTVALTSPVNGASFQAPLNLTLQAAASDSDALVARVEFFEGTNKLGEDFTAPFSVTWSNAPAGSYALFAIATDSTGLSATSAPVNITLNAGPTPLVSAGSIWRYLDNGTDQGTAWRESGFNDAAWAAGPAQLGYGDADEATVVGFGPDAQNKYVTTYFRQTFFVVDPSVFLSLTLDLLRDDGAVVYLNGTEVYRNNMPAGLIGFLTFAANGSSGETTFFRTVLAPSTLVSGLNVIAVEIHQADATSSDISFDLQLLGLTTSTPLTLIRGPYLQVGTPTSGIVRWRTDVPSDGVVFYGTDPVNLTGVAVETTSTNEHIVQISGLQPGTRYYYSIGSSTRTLASGPDYWFVTSPLPGTRQPTRVWVLGDSGTANNNARNVRNAYTNFAATNRPADLWLMLGDNAYQSGTDAEHQAAVFDMYPATLRNLFLWPTIGNHETGQSYTANNFPYLSIFSLPQNGEAGGLPSGTERYYSFDYANLHFICLDSMTSTRSATSPMAQWLRDDLTGTAQEWIIVFFHHPPYTKGNHNSDAETDLIEVRQNLLPILEAGGVDLVLCGHSHAWERSFLLNGHYGNSGTITDAMRIDGGDGRTDGTGAYQQRETAGGRLGTVYTVAGNGGQITGGSLNHAAHFLSLNELGSMVIDVSSNRLDAIFLATNGVTRDHFTLLKPLGPPPPAAPLNLLARATATNEIALAWTDASTNETGFLIERSADGTNFAPRATAAANATNAVDTGLPASATFYYRVRSVNAGGPSDPSNVASASTTPASQAPRAPFALAAASDNGVEFYRSRMVLRWRENATNESGFEIERSTDGEFYTAIGTVGADVTHYVDEGLESATAYFYRVRCFNPVGESAPSNLAGDLTHPQSDLVKVGASVTFHGGSEGAPPVRYQWRFRGASISGATNESLTLLNVQPYDEGDYSVVVTDATNRMVSNPALLFVLAPPVIVSHPASRTNVIGSTATFGVVATGLEPLSYQWRKNDADLPGATGPALVLANVQKADAGSYTVVVRNDFGGAISFPAVLTINTPPRAAPDVVTRLADEAVNIEIARLLANDSDADGDAIHLVSVNPATDQGGTAEWAGRYILYTPRAGFDGEDTFIYTLGDSRGGLSAGVVTVMVSDNTPPILSAIPDFFVNVLTPLVITNAADDAETPELLTASLGPEAPPNARLQPVTGRFLWTPTRAQAPGTHRFSVTITDAGTPRLSDTKSFTVVVNDYYELTAGSTALRAGTRGSVDLSLFSSAPLGQVQCALHYPEDRLADFALEGMSPALGSASLEGSNSNCVILTFTPAAGQSFEGAHNLARLHFTAPASALSGFVPLRLGDSQCVPEDSSLAPSSLVNAGRVAVIAEQPLLEAGFDAGGGRVLTLHGKPGVTYHLEQTADYTQPASWQSVKSVTLTQFSTTLALPASETATIFYRVRE